MLAFSVYGGVEPQRTQVRITWIHQVVLTSSNTWAAPVISARYHAASRLWAGSNLNRLRQGNSRRGEVTAETNKCPPST